MLYYLGVKFYLQQIFEGGIPRINGFSAEPSYYATFLLTGFVVNLYLLNNKSVYFGYKYLVLNQVLIFLAIILSTSKMAIPLMISVLLWSSFVDLYTRFVKNKSFYKKDLFVFPLILIAIFIGLYYFFFQLDKIRFLFGGLGIGGTVSHSVVIRERDFDNTLQTFINSPIIGYSLGGIPSAIGGLKGIEITNNVMAKKYEGMNIFMETLAGSGIVGFLFFAIFLVLNHIKFQTYYQTSKVRTKSQLLSSLCSGEA
jgi:O-antigen ligase